MHISTSSLDLGQVVNATNMAAGATVYSSFVDNLHWVRNIFILASSDQQYDVFIMRRDSSLQSDWGLGVLTAQPATGSGSYRPHAITGSNAILGHSAKFGIKNSSASPNTFGILRVQLLGL